MNIIVTEETKKTTLKEITYLMFVANPWSWVYMLFSQFIAFGMLKFRVIWEFIDHSNTSIWSSTIGLVIFLMIFWKLFVLHLRAKKKEKHPKAKNPDEFMLVENILGWKWMVDTLGDIILGVIGCLSVLIAGILL